MDVREFPVLSDDDCEFVERLEAGLGEQSARVLAYLLLRDDSPAATDDPASLLSVRVGTDLNRTAARDALSRLRDRDLVAATTVQDASRGRPPRAWYPSCDAETAVERVYGRHADALLDRATSAFEVGDGSEAGDPDRPDGENGADDDRPGSDGPDRREATVALNWTPNGLHLPLFAAAGRGEYADRGLSVDFEANDGSAASLSAVADGDADAGVAGAVSVLRARQRGDPVVPVALLYQRATTVLYAERDRFDGGLDSVEQLRDCRVGMPVESEAGLLGRLFLSQSGVLSDVELVDLAGEERLALRSGEADVVTGSFSDPLELREAGVRTDSLRVAEQFPIYGPSLVATEATLRQRSDLLADLLAATVAGWAGATRRPYGVATPRGTDFGDDERETFERAAAEFGANDAVREHGWGWQDSETWQRLETALSVANLEP